MASVRSPSSSPPPGGARVIGLASEPNHEWLAAHGVIPVAYGDGVRGPDQGRGPGGRVDAFIDTHGDGYVDLALALGVATDRIDTIIDFAAAERTGVKTDGNAVGARPEVLAELAGRVADGRLELPVAPPTRSTASATPTASWSAATPAGRSS